MCRPWRERDKNRRLLTDAATQPTAIPTSEMPGGGLHMTPCGLTEVSVEQ